ncbi:MAG: phospho-sugar mutase, partial [Firmicutes bacterium]|nr:phospho-sugar mutase [Bacillota bacterium]
VLLRREKTLNEKSTLITTIVTSNFGADIASGYGLRVERVLTGFKFIGGVINRLKKTGEGEFVIGYEESYGYLVGDHARDKDAVVASMLIAEMAAYYKERGKDLVDVLNDLYADHSYYLDAVNSYVFKGKEGIEHMAALMDQLRKTGKDLMPGIAEVKDYLPGIDGLPSSNVLKFFFEDGGWVAVRPSGTEPKIKVYYGIKGDDKAKAEELHKARKAVMDEVMKS